MKKWESHKLELSRYRYSNAKGKIIPLHHAFRTVQFNTDTILISLLLTILFSIVTWLLVPGIVTFWEYVYRISTSIFFHGNKSGYQDISILGIIVPIPHTNIEAELPKERDVWVNIIVCTVIFLISFVLPGRIAPITYLIRAALIIQASASIYFFINPDHFPYHLSNYAVDCQALCLLLMIFIPLILGFIYYIFDFSFLKKFLLTAMILLYFTITVPLQYILHSYIIYHFTYLFLPVLYFLFAILLDILMFICLYSYGMSWSRLERESKLGRYA